METYLKNINNSLKLLRISESSKKLYLQNLLQLFNKVVKKVDDFNNFSKIKLYLDDNIKNLNTYKSYLNAIIHINSNDKYKNLRFEIQKQIDYNKGCNIKNIKKFIDYEDLKNLINFDINAKNKIDYLNKYEDEMLLHFTIIYPLRLDYWKIKLIYPKSKINVSNFIKIHKNYIELFLNDYKTKDIYGTFKNKFNLLTFKIFTKYVKLYEQIYNHKPEYLFYNQKNNKSYSFKQIFTKHLEDILFLKTSLKLTNNDIRKSYETYFINSPNYNYLTNNQKEKFSNNILHSHNEAIKSYYKI